MKKEDEIYYSKQMHTLADKFNEAVRVFEKEAAAQPFDPENNPKLIQLRNEFLSFSDKLNKEFAQSGYCADDWNDLMLRSGAGKKMGMGA